MNVRIVEGSFVVDDAPGLHWLHASGFIVVGAIFVAGPLFLFPDVDRMRFWLRAAIAMLGALSLVVGSWLLLQAPRSRIVADVAQSLLRLDRWSLRGHEQLEWPLSDLVAVQLAERRDDDGDPVFQLTLVLRDARPAAMSSIWYYGRERMAEVARQLAFATGVRAVNADHVSAVASIERTDPVG
jgi:hypothetical protein